MLPTAYIPTRYNGNFTYEYHLKDHLGSVRVAFNPTADGPNIVQENAYYPFGGTIGDFSYNESENRYKHTGMEAINDFGLNMLDNNARWRDVSAVPRFYGIDPLAEKYYSISPYAYCANNPIKFIDPTGMIIKDPNGIYRRHKEKMEENKRLFQSQLSTASGVMKAALEHLIAAYDEIFREYKVLEQSEQVYDVSNATDGRNGISFDPRSGNIKIQVVDEEIGTVSHELQHAHQYEKKEISFKVDGTPGSLYDISDEVAAYNRQLLLFLERIYFTNPEGNRYTSESVRKLSINNPGKKLGYENLPAGPININSKQGRKLRQDIVDQATKGILIKEVYNGFVKDFHKALEKGKK